MQIVNLDSMKDALISWKNKIEKPRMVTIKMMILRDKLKANVHIRNAKKLWCCL